MAELQLYDKLLQFPVFQGMSRDDLSLLVGHTKFGFSKHAAGECIAKEGQECQALHLLTNGTLTIDTWADDHGYHVTEQMQAPYIIQPEALFGLTQRFTHTFETATDANLITIGKQEVLKLLGDFFVFRLNMLGIYATQSQKQLRQPWRHQTGTLRERIIRFFVDRSVYPAGPKRFYILMKRLACEVNDSRLDVSKVLNELQAEGGLRLSRGRIDIPSIEQLVMGNK